MKMIGESSFNLQVWTKCSYLSGEDTAEADDHQDVKDSWSNDGSHAHVSLCDEHP